MSDDQVKHVPIGQLKVEDGVAELLSAPAMAPYINLAIAVETGQEIDAALQEIAALPLESRYVWRVSSALKWAFADLDSINVQADRKALSDADRRQVLELLKHRPLQFCLFLSALLGQNQMEALLVSAIKQCREIVKVTGT